MALSPEIKANYVNASSQGIDYGQLNSPQYQALCLLLPCNEHEVA